MLSTDEYQYKEVSKPIKRGAFIVVEGLDRSGKTTQVKKLCDSLYQRGHNVKTIRFPDRSSPIGKMIDSYLQSKTEMDDHAIHLLFSANRWEKAKWIRETIAEGYTIVCDRYVYSGMIYSAAKKNPNLGIGWARQCDEGLPRPDLVVFLDLELAEAERRGGYGEEKYEKREMQERVKELFSGLKVAESDEAEDMKTVDAGHSIEVVAQKVYSLVLDRVSLVADGKFRDLGTVTPWDEKSADAVASFKS